MDWISSQTLQTPAQSIVERTSATLRKPHNSVSPCFDTWYALCNRRKPFTDATFSDMIESAIALSVATKQTWATQLRTSPMEQRCCKTAAHKRECSEQTECGSGRFVLIISSQLRRMKVNKNDPFLQPAWPHARHPPKFHFTNGLASTKILYQISQLVTRLEFFSKGSQLGLVPQQTGAARILLRFKT